MGGMSAAPLRWLLLAGCWQQPSAAAPRRKNILFLLADDAGFEFSPWAGNDTALLPGTPSLQRLAARGTVFDRAYTAVSSCSPSRSAILSGLPNHQNGMFGLHQPPGNFQSLSHVQSIPNLLNKAGYKTGIIGKYHVGPISSYDFTYGLTKEHCWAGFMSAGGNGPTCPSAGAIETCDAPYNYLSRNITAMKLHARKFLTEVEPEKPFFLYVGFGDAHRCSWPSVGSFCEKFGSGLRGQGSIPDWKPRWFAHHEVTVPWFLPDNAAVREDRAAQYTSINRMDQGIGLLLDELEAAGHADDTLTIFFSDNGIPFPASKTNLYEQGQGEPLVVVAPGVGRPGARSSAVVSSLDFVPTMLAWAGVKDAHSGAGEYSGSSILPLLGKEAPPASWRNVAFGSHSFHNMYAYYPMRSVVSDRYRLINNLVSGSSYPILEDVVRTKTWGDLQRQGRAGEPTGWIYDYHAYMHRPEWELFDLGSDPTQQKNLAGLDSHREVLSSMQQMLLRWRQATEDPWLLCSENSTAGACTGTDSPAHASAYSDPEVALLL